MASSWDRFKAACQRFKPKPTKSIAIDKVDMAFEPLSKVSRVLGFDLDFPFG